MKTRTAILAVVIVIWATGNLHSVFVLGQTTLPAAAAAIPQMPDNWQQMSQQQLATTLEGYFPSTALCHAEAENQRTQVAQYVWNQYLVDDQHFSQAIATDSDGLTQMIGFIADYLPPTSEAALAYRYTQMVNNQSSLATLHFYQIKHMCVTLSHLNVPSSVARNLVVQWINSSNQWTASKGNSLSYLGSILMGDTSGATISARQQLAGFAWNNYLNNANFVSTGKIIDVMPLTMAFGSQFSGPQQQQLLGGLLQRFQNSPADLAVISMKHLPDFLVSSLRSLGATDTQVAAVVAEWSEARDHRTAFTDDDGAPEEQVTHLQASMVGAADAKGFAGLIASQIQAQGGIAGPTTAMFLAFLGQTSGTLSAWSGQIDTQLNGAGLAGDARASLLLAKANAVELASGAPGNSGGLSYAQQALASAQSPKLQVACVGWLSYHFQEAQNFTQASALINTWSSQLTDASALQELSSLSLQESEAAFEASTNAKVAADQQPSVRLAGQLTYLQSQLAQAQNRGASPQDIQSIQSMIANTQQQMQATSQPSQ